MQRTNRYEFVYQELVVVEVDVLEERIIGAEAVST